MDSHYRTFSIFVRPSSNIELSMYRTFSLQLSTRGDRCLTIEHTRLTKPQPVYHLLVLFYRFDRFSSTFWVDECLVLIGRLTTKKVFIRHFHISLNAAYLPPKISHNLCFSFRPGITAVPREIENNAYAKFWGANKVHYGKCGSGLLVDTYCRRNKR